MGFLQFQVPPAPAVEGVPVPTLMLATGVLLGIVLGLASGAAARAAAAGRARTVSRKLHAAVAEVANARIVAPVADEVSRYNRFAAALAVARG
jgi:hypothetical protein